ncbi:pirin family protein [Acinetobacter seifertii]|uniref:Pirin family protein n=1 Tax=Acinetobacter seifertii TaxID=1530123 RepID=A0A7H2XG87_9GAMM|nr:pirin-like bicupin family protein [Acinetobacter seifertii]QNX13295.1 pirin family protein [Acinetobacter seifertii]QNX18660.1 pirin family protein [Acinetobacter seifertii]QNX25332.1 pirin family protein [Acinetobacter seifertii]QNX36295.1 pirin family protein [Acinetobacter seifertii]QNX40121.1 pirin family protein [Acinetobacter seifertii]
MNAFLHRSEDRGHVKAGWLESYHSFSFGNWYNPKYMGVSALRVINDDRIDAHNGFGTHSHDNMEILTCVLDGAISHRDTMGNEGQIKAGEWQLMSAGTGVAHSEINNTDTPVHLLQIWIIPDVKEAEPNYQQINLDPRKDPNKWHLIAGPDVNAPMHIRQNAEVKSAVLEKGNELPVETSKRVNYVHVISGVIRIGDQEVKAGDALVFEDNAVIHALEDSQFIWFDLP